jgi:hypothetical protein
MLARNSTASESAMRGARPSLRRPQTGAGSTYRADTVGGFIMIVSFPSGRRHGAGQRAAAAPQPESESNRESGPIAVIGPDRY